jgi:hypothetical protein
LKDADHANSAVPPPPPPPPSPPPPPPTTPTTPTTTTATRPRNANATAREDEDEGDEHDDDDDDEEASPAPIAAMQIAVAAAAAAAADRNRFLLGRLGTRRGPSIAMGSRFLIVDDTDDTRASLFPRSERSIQHTLHLLSYYSLTERGGGHKRFSLSLVREYSHS